MKDFIANIKQIVDPLDETAEPNVYDARKIVYELNRFLYTNREGIGTTWALEAEREYFSDFHKYWEAHYREILDPTVDDVQCEIVADALHDVFEMSPEAFTELYDTCGLSKEDVCRVRFFSAPQDFRGSREFSKLAKIFKSDPSVFSCQRIFDDPEGFLSDIKVTGLSQNDKRVKYAKSCANFLLDKGIEPHQMLDYYDGDLVKLRDALTGTVSMGFGNKKTGMFLRDMAVHEVWTDYLNFDRLDVASDINTMKVALRTGILETAIPLVSSFIDIFCHQYVYMDEMNAVAWRRVWEIWSAKHPGECVTSPCMIDYFVYRVIGRECCGDKFSLYRGLECGHEFYWHSGRNRTCQVCYAETGERKPAKRIGTAYPCMCEDEKLFYAQKIAKDYPYLRGLEGCPFSKACKPKESDFVMLQPPKSISILGRTGWTSAYAREGEGGGGLQA